MRDVLGEFDAVVEAGWRERGVVPVGAADSMLVVRRISLALTGTVPSLEELRELEAVAEEERVDWWLAKLFADRRTSDYLAERLARMLVGVEGGPFLVYRRRRMVNWLSDELWEGRRYDELVRNLIAAEGIWTSEPEVNFLTVTIDQNEEGGEPDEVKLAARVSRAFLGVRIDCVECHDDMFGERWKQSDFHQLAAYFGDAKMALSGVRDDDELVYETRYRGEIEAVEVAPRVPFSPELMAVEGTLRERLAGWVTHVENGAFARATVNRFWALMFNKPLVEPIDDIPLEGPWPGAMEFLAEDFVEYGFDVRRLVGLIAGSRVFGLESRAADGEVVPGEEQEESWAVFPMTRLRPEQVAGSVLQASSLRTIDAESHVLKRLLRMIQQGDFIKRYGDGGEDEFEGRGGTIPQRLLMMNGELLRGRTEDNVVMNASTRIGALAPDDGTAVDSAYEAVLTRLPGDEERAHFVGLLAERGDKGRAEVMADLFWVLMNSTEFSWNH